jgi:hypothetical protein
MLICHAYTQQNYKEKPTVSITFSVLYAECNNHDQYVEFWYVECGNGDCCYTDYNLDNGRYAECRNAERPYTGCYGTTYTSFCKQKATVSQCYPSLTFVGKAGAYPGEFFLQSSTLRVGIAWPSNVRLKIEEVTNSNKRSSLQICF